MWRGTARESEHPLLDHATAITSFVPEDKSNARMPVLAVAIGQHVYMMRGLKPFYRFTLPPEPVQAQEEEAWCALHCTARIVLYHLTVIGMPYSC